MSKEKKEKIRKNIVMIISVIAGANLMFLVALLDGITGWRMWLAAGIIGVPSLAWIVAFLYFNDYLDI